MCKDCLHSKFVYQEDKYYSLYCKSARLTEDVMIKANVPGTVLWERRILKVSKEKVSVLWGKEELCPYREA